MRTIRERFNPIRIKERTSVIGSYTPFERDIYRERFWNPHEEMYSCIRMYNENSLAQSAINTMKEFIMGGEIKYISDDTIETSSANGYIESIDMYSFMSEVVENTIKTGNGYLESDFDKFTRLRKRFYPIADSSRIYINCDDYGNPKKIDKLVNIGGVLKNVEVDNDEEFFIQRLEPGFRQPKAKWYDMSYATGFMFRKFRIYGIPIHKDKIMHFKLNIGDTGIYGRAQIASALNDNEVLREVEQALAIIAKYKAVPRDVIQYGDKELPASSDELDDFVAYMETLEKDETAIINKPIKREILSYAGQDINLDYIIQHIRKKIIVGIAPDFMMGLGDSVNRATAGQELLSYVLAIYSKRRLFLKLPLQLIIIPYLKSLGFKPTGHLEFGQLDFETKSEKETRILQQWNANLITLNQALEAIDLPLVEDEQGEMRSIELQNAMMPDLMGGFGGFGEKMDTPSYPRINSNIKSINPLFKEQIEEEGEFPHNPTGTLLLQRNMAIHIRKVFRNKLREILNLVEKNKKKIERNIRTEAIIGVEAIDNISSSMIGVGTLIKPIMNEYIRKSFLKGNSNVAHLLRMGKFVPFKKRHLQALQDNAFSYVSKFSEGKRNELKEILTEGVSQGDDVSTISSQIKNSFNVVASRSEAIARTEIIRTYNEASIQATKDSGVTNVVRYITAYDDRVCSQCKPLNRKIMKISSLKTNVNKPPLHPNCRCALVPHIEVKK